MPRRYRREGHARVANKVQQQLQVLLLCDDDVPVLHGLDGTAVGPGSDLVLRRVDLVHDARPVVHAAMLARESRTEAAHGMVTLSLSAAVADVCDPRLAAQPLAARHGYSNDVNLVGVNRQRETIGKDSASRFPR